MTQGLREEIKPIVKLGVIASWRLSIHSSSSAHPCLTFSNNMFFFAGLVRLYPMVSLKFLVCVSLYPCSSKLDP